MPPGKVHEVVVVPVVVVEPGVVVVWPGQSYPEGFNVLSSGRSG